MFRDLKNMWNVSTKYYIEFLNTQTFHQVVQTIKITKLELSCVLDCLCTFCADIHQFDVHQ